MCARVYPRVPVPACTCYVRVFLRTSRECPCVCESALLHDSTVASMKPSGTENNEWLERRKCSLFSSSLELTLRSIRHRRSVVPRRSCFCACRILVIICSHLLRARALSLAHSFTHTQAAGVGYASGETPLMMCKVLLVCVHISMPACLDVGLVAWSVHVSTVIKPHSCCHNRSAL